METCCYGRFSSFIKFWSSERNTGNTMSDLYLMKKVIILKKMTSDNENFRSTIFQSFQFEPEQKKTCVNESHEKETKHIYASAADLHAVFNSASVLLNFLSSFSLWLIVWILTHLFFYLFFRICPIIFWMKRGWRMWIIFK